MKQVNDLKELEKRVIEHPMTLDSVKYILKNKIARLSYFSCIKNSNVSKSLLEDGKYNIAASAHENPKNQKISLIHKIAHIYYDVTAINQDDVSTLRGTIIEGYMDLAARRFYRKYPKQSDRYYLKVAAALKKLEKKK